MSSAYRPSRLTGREAKPPGLPRRARGGHNVAVAGEISERVRRVMDAIDDPCDEGGYDTFCRNRQGELCPEHAEHCRPPDYPCMPRLRERLAKEIVAINDLRRAGEDA